MDSIESLVEEIKRCNRCKLSKTRTNAVPGEGSIDKGIVFVGEAPGKNEDILGRPFVGAAGKILDEMFAEVRIERKDVYITNIVKCRPPNNRDPLDEEISACSLYLERQFKIIRPKIVCTLGFYSTRYVLGRFGINVNSISRYQGKIYEFEEFTVLPMFHPAAVIYNRELFESLRESFQKFKKIVDLYLESKKGEV